MSKLFLETEAQLQDELFYGVFVVVVLSLFLDNLKILGII